MKSKELQKEMVRRTVHNEQLDSIRMTTRNWIFAILIGFNALAVASHVFLIFVWPDYPDQVADPRRTVLWLAAVNIALLILLVCSHWRGTRH